jgi:hypothetical protein
MAGINKEQAAPIHGMSPTALAQIQQQNMAGINKEQAAPIHGMSPAALAQIQQQNMAGINKEPIGNHLGKGQSSIGLPTSLDASMSNYDPSTAIPLNQLTAEDLARINQRNSEGIAKEEGTTREHTFKNTLSEAERPERRADERMEKVKQDYILGQKIKNNEVAPARRRYEELAHLRVLRQEEEAKQGGFNVHDSDEVRKMDKRDAIRLVDSWILELAQSSGHAALITGAYAKLSIEEKIRVFEQAGVDLNLETPQSSTGLQRKFKSKLKLWQGRETEWNTFSLAIRQVSGNSGLHNLVSAAQRGNEDDDTAGGNPYASTKADHVEMGSGLAMITTGFTGAGVKLGTENGVGEIGLAGSVAGVVFSLNNIIRITNESGDHQIPERILGDALMGLSETANVIHNTSKGLLEIGLMTSQAAEGGGISHIAAQEATSQAAQAGINGIALSVLGITAIIKGSIDIVQGGYAIIDSRKIRAALEKLEKEISSPDFKLACTRAAETQRVRRNMGAAKMLSGAAMVAGGAMLTAGLISNPIGWILLTAAGLISLGAAIYKMQQKSKSAKKFVTQIYNMQFNNDDDTAVDDATLNIWLNGLGYANGGFGSFHNEFMLRLAEGLHSAAFGAEGTRKEEARKVLQTIKLKINENKRTPTPQTIAKRLRNP